MKRLNLVPTGALLGANAFAGEGRGRQRKKEPAIQAKLLLAATLLALVGCQEKAKPAPEIAPSAAAPIASEAPKEESLADKVRKAGSLDAMWSICRPLMEDRQPDGDENLGAACASLYFLENGLPWSQVAVQKDETSPGLIMKNSAKERGKRLCATGRIIEIHEDKSGNASNGLLRSYSGTLYHFETFGSSGTLTEGRQGRFCGFVVGQFHYRNSGGGVGHAVDVLGVWDLPENKP